MAKTSAGLLMYCFRGDSLQVFLVHPGGPYWSKKDLGAWSIPKGLYEVSEDPLTAAKREFEEETGFMASGQFIPLTPLKQKSGKVIYAWAFEGNYEPSLIKSNLFTMEWPPHSGRMQEFPEIDRAEWFDIEQARKKIIYGQAGFLDELVKILSKESS